METVSLDLLPPETIRNSGRSGASPRESITHAKENGPETLLDAGRSAERGFLRDSGGPLVTTWRLTVLDLGRSGWAVGKAEGIGGGAHCSPLITPGFPGLLGPAGDAPRSYT